MHLRRERLDRILRILDSNAGAFPLRQFRRLYSLWEWELEQAAALGWVKIQTIKPRTGRPSRIVLRVSKFQPRNFPPLRLHPERKISLRHWRFALYSTCYALKGSRKRFQMPPFVAAYQIAFPGARNGRAAAASMSRLLRHPRVRAARQWFYAKGEGAVPIADPMPETATGIWQALRAAGSWRVQCAPAAEITGRPWI